MNNINLIGNLVHDPELKTLPNSDNMVTKFTIAVQRPFKRDEVDYIPIIVWGKQAESCATYLAKGKKAGVTGYLTIRSYEAKDGTKKYVAEVTANQVEFLTPKGDAPTNSFKDMVPSDDADIPF